LLINCAQVTNYAQQTTCINILSRHITGKSVKRGKESQEE